MNDKLKDIYNPRHIRILKMRIEDSVFLDNPPTEEEIKEFGYFTITRQRWKEQHEKEAAGVDLMSKFALWTVAVCGVVAILAEIVV